MTRKELIQRDFKSHSFVINPILRGGVSGCPHDYGLGPGRFFIENAGFSGCRGYSNDSCTLCWNEEVKEDEYETYVKIIRDTFGKEL